MLAYDGFVIEVMNATKEVNHTAAEDEKLLRSVCEEVVDRVSLYLNLPNTPDKPIFDERLVRVAARIVSGIFTQTAKNVEGDTDDTQINSLSDNGQSVTYGEKTKNYLASASDGELFGGFSELLKPFRRVHVVS